MRRNVIKFTSLLLTLFIIALTVSAFIFDASAEFAGSGGVGTKDNPYLISKLADLEEFNEYITYGNEYNYGEGEYFKLTANIDMSEKYNEDNHWKPIGAAFKGFRGEFDGDGHTISGVYIDNQGLFYKLGEKATVKNLTIKGDIKPGSGGTVGGITGENDGGTILNCCNACNIEPAQKIGGIVGINVGGTIENCYNIGQIRGFGNLGGIAAECEGGRIANCYNIGNVTATGSNTSSGIVGTVSNYGQIENCYYMEGTANNGVGGEAEDVSLKTSDAFKSGEVSWLLQNGNTDKVWGQNIGTDDYPVWTSEEDKHVFKVTFSTDGNENYAARYANPNGTVELPSEPSNGDKIFAGWSVTGKADGDIFNEKTLITNDITVKAIWVNAGEESMYGELSGDSLINSIDAYIIRRIAGGLTVEDKYRTLADVDADGNVTDDDVRLLNQYIIGTVNKGDGNRIGYLYDGN